MQVSRGNILKLQGCSVTQNFINKRIIGILVQDLLRSGKGSIYFLYPLTSLPKMVKQEVPTSIEQNQLFVL